MPKEINININIPSDGGDYPQPQTQAMQQVPQQAIPQQMPQQMAPVRENMSKPKRRKEVASLVEKVEFCHNWRNLYELRNQFIRHGLSIENTPAGRLIMCRIDEYGRPVTKNIVDDFIYLNNQNQLDEEISERTSEVICSFIDRNAGVGESVNYNDMPDYQRHAALYGDSLSEQELQESQQIAHMGRLLTEDEQ